MTRSDLIELIAARNGLSQQQSKDIVSTLFGSIATTLQAGDTVAICGFGKFIVKDYKPYVGRNPLTGERVAVKAKKVPFFKAGTVFKKRIENLGKEICSDRSTVKI